MDGDAATSASLRSNDTDHGSPVRVRIGVGCVDAGPVRSVVAFLYRRGDGSPFAATIGTTSDGPVAAESEARTIVALLGSR
jgi:hypothetical protein